MPSIPRRSRPLALLALAAWLAGCGDDALGVAHASATAAPLQVAPRIAATEEAPRAAPPRASPDVVRVPASIRAGEKRPFVLYLHGLGISGKTLVDALGVAAIADELRFSYAAPDGAMNAKKQRYWSASRACCNFDGDSVDHVAALRSIVDAARAHPSVDPARVYVIGFSNGGFMAHRLACDVPGITGIASIAGAGPAAGDPSCTPRAPVTVIQVHGDADTAVRYEGGRVLGGADLIAHPSARETIAAWAKRDGCSGGPSPGAALDLEDRLDAAETGVTRYAGCKRAVELWTVRGGSHHAAQGKRAQAALFAALEKNTP